MLRSTLIRLTFSLIAVFPVSPLAAQPADAPRPVERGTFRIYKYLQPMGTETFEVFADGDGRRLKTRVEMSFIGSAFSMDSELRMRADGTPLSFRAEGGTSTQSSTNAVVEVRGARAAVRQGTVEGEVDVPARFFTWAHYGPLAVEEALFRYWSRHGRPERLPLLPAGEVRFRRRGTEDVSVDGRTVTLERYGVDGLVWGTRTLWFDGGGRLIAGMSGDAELDRIGAVREGFESALPQLAASARRDALADLRALAERIRPEREGTFALVNARLIDGTGAPPVDSAVVLVRDGKIAAVGRGVRVPDGVARVDVGGATVLPGLWDMHVHYSQPEWLAVSLASGVTTARDAGNEMGFITDLRDAVRRGEALGPRILAAGVIDGGEHPVASVFANTPDEARAAVRAYHEAGFEQLKIYGSLPPALVPIVAEEAHRRGMTVTGHVPTGMNAVQFVEAGVDQINHAAFVAAVLGPRGQPLDVESDSAKRAIDFFRRRGTVVDPTLARTEQHVHSRDTAYARYEPGAAKAPLELREALNTSGAPADQAPRLLARHAQLASVVGALHRAGVPILLGSDLAVPGHTFYREMELAARAGLTPMEIIQAATIVPARVMGLDAESGTVEPGKRADLVIVDGDPLRDISRIRNVRAVVAAGRLFRSAPLWEASGFAP